MPIVTRTLIKLADREDIGPGWKTWMVEGVDSRGNNWKHGPFKAVQANAETIRDTCWATSQIEDQEENDAIEECVNGADFEAVPLNDITRAEFRRRVAKRFWRGTLDRDRAFMEKAAVYIATFTANQIATSLGITVQKAQAGIDKAILIRDTLTSNMASIDNAAEEV